MGSIICFDRIIFVSHNPFLISESLGLIKENICFLKVRCINRSLVLKGQHLLHMASSSEITLQLQSSYYSSPTKENLSCLCICEIDCIHWQLTKIRAISATGVVSKASKQTLSSISEQDVCRTPDGCEI